MKTFCHSGSFGDLLYSLPIVKYFGGGELIVKLNSINYITAKYSYAPEHVSDFHRGKLTDQDYEFIRALLESQPYIKKVSFTYDPTLQADYDLDSFRGVLFRTFAGNYLEAYYKTFNIPYTDADLIQPWLTVTPKTVASTVIGRTFRYRNSNSAQTWQHILSSPAVKQSAVFVGLADEHADFEQTFNCTVPFYKCSSLLEMAEVIAGGLYFVGNQSVAYCIAQGLNKTTYLEAIPDRPLVNNECFFKRANCYYF